MTMCTMQLGTQAKPQLARTSAGARYKIARRPYVQLLQSLLVTTLMVVGKEMAESEDTCLHSTIAVSDF